MLIWIAGQKKLKRTFIDRQPLPKTERTYSFLYALKRKWEWVDLADSVGRMCAENAGVTPPCLPVVVAGEIISVQAAELLSSSKKTFGIDNGKIKVVKK
jgi:arginine/lysine/ornithine decarboxylase